MGCFWHNHPGCSLARIPQTAFDWEGKMARNRRRDARVRAELIARGYRVLWVWECAVRGASALSRSELDTAVADFIGSAGTFAEIEGREVQHRRMARAG
jgi:DNA mismatch endonuclease (patch repair protein)